MKFFAKIACFAISLSLCMSAAWAQKKTWDRTGTPPGTQAVSVGEVKLRYNRYLSPYLPSDIQSIKEPTSVSCDEQGRRVHYDEKGRCLDYYSDSTGTKWRIRFESERGREGARILQLKGSGTVLYAHFDLEQRPIYVSPEASRMAQAHPLPQQALQDCGRLNVLEKMRCEVNNKAAVGVGIRAR